MWDGDHWEKKDTNILIWKSQQTRQSINQGFYDGWYTSVATIMDLIFGSWDIIYWKIFGFSIKEYISIFNYYEVGWG